MVKHMRRNRVKHLAHMKNYLFFLLLFSGLAASAQKITGFYTGTLVNDSNKMVQSYELALSEYRGKITGYSYVTFVRNDSLFYGIRRVKGHIQDNKLIVQDDDFIANNFPEAPAKGVKRLFVFPITADSMVSMSGTWQTNRTKKYYSIPGNAELARSNDSSRSSLFRHLKELELMTTIAATSQPAEKKPAPVKEKPQEKPAPPKEVKLAKAEPEVKEPKPKPAEPKPVVAATVPYNQRMKKEAGAVTTTADSLVLSFFDNGVIDGDSVSVYVNGQLLIPSTKLTATAVRRTVAVTGEVMEILLVADNLGTIPPNTGLVVIRDGEQRYQLNFSADLQTNATIIIKRSKKP